MSAACPGGFIFSHQIMEPAVRAFLVLHAVVEMENCASAVGDAPSVRGDRDLAGDDQRHRLEGGMVAEVAAGFALDRGDFGESSAALVR